MSRIIPETMSSLPLSTSQTTNTLVARTAVTPTTRIVVVRTTSSTQNEQGETIESNESARSKSVELPPVLTNGRTSVYLIRRPIPPAELSRPTQVFEDEDLDEVKRTTTKTTTITDGVDTSEHSRTPTPTEEMTIPSDLPNEEHQPSRRRRTSKRRSRFKRSDSPNHLLSSPTQSGNSQPRTRRLRSRSKSRRRSRSAKRGVSPDHRSPTPPPPPPSPSTEEQPKEIERKRSFFSLTRTKSKAVQADLPLPESVSNETRTIRPLASRRIRRKKSDLPRVKSAKSIVLVNPDDQTTATVENSYLRSDTMKPGTHQSSRRTRVRPDTDSQSTEEFVKTSRSHRCLACLSRHMCLIVVICLILVVIGLAGVGASAYFLITADSQNNPVPEIVGLVVGGVLAIAALCFLCCILGCLGSRDGYFTYNDDATRTGGRVFALIPPTHSNAHLYIPRDYSELREQNPTPTLTSTSTIPRQKTIIHEMNGTTNTKNVTIEMPERLLTGRKMSPKSHERKLTKVVHHIGHVVEDTKKRYHGEAPSKIIVKVDENVKATV